MRDNIAWMASVVVVVEEVVLVVTVPDWRKLGGGQQRLKKRTATGQCRASGTSNMEYATRQRFGWCAGGYRRVTEVTVLSHRNARTAKAKPKEDI